MAKSWRPPADGYDLVAGLQRRLQKVRPEEARGAGYEEAARRRRG